MKKGTLLVLLAAVLIIGLVTGCSAGQCTGVGRNYDSGTGTCGDRDGADDGDGRQRRGSASHSNFRLLVSDEPNAIGNFTALRVDISGLAFVRPRVEGMVTKSLNTSVEVDLTELQGDNAVEVWNGCLPEGDYAKVFLYVANVTSVPERDIKLPGGKLHISKPFSINATAENTTVDFVFDITVIEAGKSGKYILKPQLSESGPDQPFTLLERSQAGVRIRDRDRMSRPEDAGKPDHAGKPADAGRPEYAGKPEDVGKPDHAGKPEDAGRPEYAGKPEGAGRPEDAGKPDNSRG